VFSWSTFYPFDTAATDGAVAPFSVVGFGLFIAQWNEMQASCGS